MRQGGFVNSHRTRARISDRIRRSQALKTASSEIGLRILSLTPSQSAVPYYLTSRHSGLISEYFLLWKKKVWSNDAVELATYLFVPHRRFTLRIYYAIDMSYMFFVWFLLCNIRWFDGCEPESTRVLCRLACWVSQSSECYWFWIDSP